MSVIESEHVSAMVCMMAPTMVELETMSSTGGKLISIEKLCRESRIAAESTGLPYGVLVKRWRLT